MNLDSLIDGIAVRQSGPDVEVLEPEELRCLVGERARAVAAHYRFDEASNSNQEANK